MGVALCEEDGVSEDDSLLDCPCDGDSFDIVSDQLPDAVLDEVFDEDDDPVALDVSLTFPGDSE